ncbi:hypothetical protein DL98DRAFT_466661 [Cadophora sp. DSE1049]|nr:hypothetical protein DL98DRAFT_466661 [Cadophora sp. DSE1049]
MASDTDPEPLVVKLTLPGFTADTRLKVFSVKFHTHSMLLKIHSAFFRKFLDSPDKLKSKTGGSAFKHEWVTQKQPDDIVEFKKPIDSEVLHFKMLLQAMYNEPIEFEDCNDLRQLTELADYYCALKVVSFALDATIGRGAFPFSQLQKQPCEMLQVAARLRHPRLFRECLILSIGPFSKPKIHMIEDPKLHKLAKYAHAQVGLLAAEAQIEIINVMEPYRLSNPKLRNEMQARIEDAGVMCRKDPRTAAYLPAYYRKLWDFKYDGIVTANPFRKPLSEVMANHLTFNRGYEAGEGQFRDFFFCGQILNEELPWNAGEKDW